MQLPDELANVGRWAGKDLPDQYVTLVIERGGQFCSDIVRVDALDEVIDRNQVYETKAYCPGFLAIGDDSGGRAIVIGLGGANGPVFLVDHGSMDVADFFEVASDIPAWASAGFPVVSPK